MVGGGRLRLIKSTTGSKVPSSACTRRPDEISTDGTPLHDGRNKSGEGRRRRRHVASTTAV
ncbi:hypothetical protein F511_41161 [Dorcoceras hygrometricum]|uniref:Uncharacterized protein n=1 Tax=Dorcoceras hygrometricum TaxID=472368 RepID=A0A2Z7D9T7_9LAMI|nr:hypothetical protein F511_41161 [Dorcoceras hygrometricum]